MAGVSDMKRTIITAILFFATVLAAQAQSYTTTYTFRDVRQPNGQIRHGNLEAVDARACGMTSSMHFYNRPAAMEKCMLARGWALDQITREPMPDSSPAWGPADPATQAAIDASNQMNDDLMNAFRQEASQEPIAAVNAATIGQ
jgi:hypothetical protein